jgi:septal ring-binding cell division protein DamX
VAEPRDGWHRRTEDRLAKLDRRVGTGLALVSLLALSLAAAGWWWTRSSIEVLESRQPPVVETAPAVVPPDALAQGVAALEQVRAEADGFLKHTERLIALIERHSDAQVEAQERMIGLLESLPLSTEAGSPLRILPADVGMPEPEPVESAGRTGVSTTGEGAGPSAAPDQLLRDPDAGDAAPTPAVEEGGVSVPPPDRPPGPVTALTEEGTIAGLWGVSPEALADLESDLPQEAGSDVAPPAQEADSGISTPQDAQPEVGLDAAGPPVPDAAGPDSGPGAGAGQDAAGARGPLVLTEERYIVQLIGFRTRGSVAAFAEEMGIRSEARYLEMRFGGRPWYGVILGNYASEAEAEAAAEAMPQTLRDLDPWIRSIPPGSELLPIE